MNSSMLDARTGISKLNLCKLYANELTADDNKSKYSQNL